MPTNLIIQRYCRSCQQTKPSNEFRKLSAHCLVCVAANRLRRSPVTRQCRTCKEVKSLPEFTGPSSYCLACVIARGAQPPRKKAEYKVCAKCGHEYSAKRFPFNRASIDGMSSWCLDCHAEWKKHDRKKQPDKYKAQDRQRYKAAPLRQKNTRLKGEYGITIADYDRMVVAQKGLCAICKQQPPNGILVIDHNHATGTVRELLCPNHNSLLGMAREDTSVLNAAIEYLRRHSQGSLL